MSNCNNFIKRVIGVTRTFNWTITTNGAAVPLVADDLTLQLVPPRGEAVSLPFDVDDNIVSFTWQGEDQHIIGCYSLILWANFGEENQRRVDIHNFVELIPWSDRQSGEYSDLVEETIELETADFGENIMVVDNLNSTSATDALSANMGRQLNVTKQDVIADLAAIRSGAAAGAAVKEWAKNDPLITDDATQASASRLNFNGNLFEQWVPGIAASIGLKGIAGFLKLADISQWDSAYNDRMLPTVAAVKAKLQAVLTALATIEAVIPSQASSTNKLTDKDYVDGAIATNTANFVGTFDTLAELQAVPNPTKNDYGFVIEQDAQGNEYYDRYKYTGTQWLYEYKVESTPFTTEQWAAIQSGITAALVSKLSALPTNAELNTALASKQPVINDLTTIRSGAAAGATAYQKPSGGIPASDMASAVQTSLGKADAAAPQSTTYTKTEVDAALALKQTSSQLATINGSRIDQGGNVTIVAAEGQTITIDAAPTAGSNNAVSSGGVYNKVTPLEQKVNGAIIHTKNLADSAIRDDSHYINSSNKIGTENGNLLIIFPCLGETTYTISKIKTTRFRVAYFEAYPSNNVQGYGAVTDHTATHITITTGANATYIAAWVYNSSGESVTKNAVMASLQIELGSEATAYVHPGWTAEDSAARSSIDALDSRLDDFDAQLGGVISQAGRLESDLSTITDYRKRNSSIYVGVDIDASWESVDGVTQTNSLQYNNITRKQVRCATFVGPSNNGIARVRLSRSVNANLHPFILSVCIGDYSDIENAPAGDVKIIFYSGSQAFASSRAMSIPIQTATSNPEYNPVFNRNGWICLCAFLTSYEGIDAGISFDPADVTGFGIQLVNARSLPVTAHIERMDFLDSVMSKPGIVTIVDNFNPQVPAMADYAHSKGVRLNLSIIPGYYEGAAGAPTCASKEELARLAAQGHFIWNHTWTHPNFNDISVPQIHDQINLAERWMQLNGYGAGKRIVSIPSARFNTRSCNAALDTNVEMFFHSWVRQKKQVFIPFAPVIRLLPTTWLDSDALNAGESGADIATTALKCLTYNGLAVIGFHGTYITNEGGGMDEWEAYIDAIAASNAYHYGLDEILEGAWN